MTTRKFFTQQELDEAKNQLENLPDLSRNRITREGAIEHLKETILMLAKERGYSVADIKSSLDAMKFNFSAKAISGVINAVNENKKTRQKKQTKSET